MKKFKELTVWQKAMDLVVEIYRISRLLPDEEKFGLVSQIRRAAVSIVANIAEGSGRNSQKELKNFLSMASGSSTELETELLVIKRIGLLTDSQLAHAISLVDEVQKC